MLSESLPLTIVGGPFLLSAVAVMALVLSDLNESRMGRFLFKPLAAAAFIWLALALDATATPYGSWLLGGLIFCMMGDLLLMPDGELTFLAGLGAFLCGHLLFAIAFIQLPLNLTGLLVVILPALALLIFAGRWLQPHVPAKMKLPVVLYITVITAMLICSAMTAGQPAATWIIVGAWGFALSDLAVARRQFIDPSRMNALWGTPLYFCAQMVLACTIAFV
ncbi:MAG: putative membrane protein YhhN [Halioglobus sp.]|jgi:uncharacterized membrane protein YhhN